MCDGPRCITVLSHVEGEHRPSYPWGTGQDFNVLQGPCSYVTV